MININFVNIILLILTNILLYEASELSAFYGSCRHPFPLRACIHLPVTSIFRKKVAFLLVCMVLDLFMITYSKREKENKMWPIIWIFIKFSEICFQNSGKFSTCRLWFLHIPESVSVLHIWYFSQIHLFSEVGLEWAIFPYIALLANITHPDQKKFNHQLTYLPT